MPESETEIAYRQIFAQLLKDLGISEEQFLACMPDGGAVRELIKTKVLAKDTLSAQMFTVLVKFIEHPEGIRTYLYNQTQEH